MPLARDHGSRVAIQAFAPVKGLCNLTTGTHSGMGLAHCADDGDIEFSWPDGGSDVIPCAAGDDLAITDDVTVTIQSGTFHLA